MQVYCLEVYRRGSDGHMYDDRNPEIYKNASNAQKEADSRNRRLQDYYDKEYVRMLKLYETNVERNIVLHKAGLEGLFKYLIPTKFTINKGFEGYVSVETVDTED